MKSLLKSPAVYQLYQELGGFFGARLVAIGDYLPIAPGARVIDIGCGPGHIVRHLPRGIDYIGFDVDEAGIDYARRHFGHLGQFHARIFGEDEAREWTSTLRAIRRAIFAALLDKSMQPEELRDELQILVDGYVGRVPVGAGR